VAEVALNVTIQLLPELGFSNALVSHIITMLKVSGYLLSKYFRFENLITGILPESVGFSQIATPLQAAIYLFKNKLIDTKVGPWSSSIQVLALSLVF
jgi:hypothetical protein